jgi:uncharacterized protein YndB with AHSA1/START domain
MSASAQVSVLVAAEPVRAFAAFAGEIALWWRPHRLFATTPRAPGVLAILDPGPEGRLVEALADGRTYELGRVLAWEPPHRLLLGFKPASFGAVPATEIEVRFVATGEGTRVSVAHRGWERVPQAHAARHGFPEGVLMMRLGEWWNAQLGRYKARLAPAGPT